jgi:Flp pilus assembly protein TadB
MPLSEHEQRLLDEMERSLYQNDADFVAKVGGARVRPSYRAVVLGILLAVVGVGILLTGVLVQVIVVGILGFAVMLVGVLVAITPGRARRAVAAAGDEKETPSAKPAQQPGFMDKLNERWDKRRDGDH